MKKRHIQKLVVLSLGLFFILNIPFLLIFNLNDAILGIPIIYFAIFSIWALSIIISYSVLKKHYE
nr:hypothetical protein [uncultured Maribacter sp.]